MITEEGQFDAHIGISPGGSKVHVYPYHSVICSSCGDQHIDFKITMEELKKMKRLFQQLKPIEEDERTTGETGKEDNPGRTNVCGISYDEGRMDEETKAVSFKYEKVD